MCHLRIAQGHYVMSPFKPYNFCLKRFFLQSKIKVIRGDQLKWDTLYIYCDVAVPRASAEFLPNREARTDGPRQAKNSENRVAVSRQAFILSFISELYRILFLFSFWYE